MLKEDRIMGFIAWIIFIIIAYTILVVLAGMLFIGLVFVVYAIVKYFKNGADVNARSPDGETALQKINKDIEYYEPDSYRYD